MRNRLAFLSFVALGLLFATRAAASACVEIDGERDTLSEQERSAARSLFLQALETNGQAVSPGRNGAGCTSVYRLYNVRLGNSVSTTVSGPRGTRTAQLRTIEDLPNVYDQMVRSFLSGQPMSTNGLNVTRDNVTANQAAPRRAEADSLWYARLGYGLTLGGASAAGPAFGGGYRYELDRLGIDLSFFNLAYQHTESTTGQNDASISGSWARILAYYFADPTGNFSLYAGGGLSWGGAAVSSSGHTYSGSGIQGELSAGYEMLRASSIRLFVQADATLPFYTSTYDNTDYITGITTRGSRYTPTFVIALGGAFGRSNLIRVNVVP